jgi:hypothetical protein
MNLSGKNMKLAGTFKGKEEKGSCCGLKVAGCGNLKKNWVYLKKRDI